jgi:glutathione synthase/RimK-type ligase-like ATP-grasp enzyme
VRVTAGTILLWGLPADPPIAAVRDALQRAGCPVTLLDQRAVADTEVELSVDSSIEGRLRVKNETFDLAAVKAFYVRPYDAREFPHVTSAGPDSALWRHALALQDILLSWADFTPALVLNRPSDMAANGSKPYQASWIESLGFRIPDTLITTDPDAALEFWRQHDQVIYKSVSGIRSIVSRLTAKHKQRFDNIASCPTQFQQYVRGQEYRVHIVAEEVFACAIVSEADDYRYATGSVDMQPCDLPVDVAARCRTLAAAMNLPLAGLDLRCTPEGEWYCFEVNPSPAFTCFQQKTRQPIAEAVARLLASALEESCSPSFENRERIPECGCAEEALLLSRAAALHD